MILSSNFSIYTLYRLILDYLQLIQIESSWRLSAFFSSCLLFPSVCVHNRFQVHKMLSSVWNNWLKYSRIFGIRGEWNVEFSVHSFQIYNCLDWNEFLINKQILFNIMYCLHWQYAKLFSTYVRRSKSNFSYMLNIRYLANIFIYIYF